MPLRGRILQALGASSFAFAAMSPDPPADATPEALHDIASSMYARTFVACYATWGDPAVGADKAARLPRRIAEFGPPSAGHYIGEVD